MNSGISAHREQQLQIYLLLGIFLPKLLGSFCIPHIQVVIFQSGALTRLEHVRSCVSKQQFSLLLVNEHFSVEVGI